MEGFSTQEITKSDIIAAEIKPRVSQSEQGLDQRNSIISTPGSGVDSQLQGLGSAEGGPEQTSEVIISYHFL